MLEGAASAEGAVACSIRGVRREGPQRPLLRGALGRTAHPRVDRPATSGASPGLSRPIAHPASDPGSRLDPMRTRRRPAARLSHHPVVHCEGSGRWLWSCGCGARGFSSPGGWHGAITAALVHQSQVPGE